LISTLVAGAHPDLGTVTGHRYPYSACSFHGSPSYPTIARLLSDNASAGVARSVGKAVAIARRAGLQFRLTELNSVTCGGVAGVSNTFATALWFPDAAFELARAGVQGINLHARLNAINGPFAFNARGLVARPLLYGMLMFARTLGPDSQVVPLGLHAGRRADVKAWAVRIGGDQLRTLVINKGPAPVRATLRLPATTTATVQRLLAPSVHSRFGVTIGGQWLDAHGIWRGKRVTQAIAPSWSGSYELTMRGYSAALVTVQLPSPA